MHVQADPPPHVFEDEVSLKLAAPPDGWRNRPDMSAFTRPFRASILARARFIEDLVAEQVAGGVRQYVILGAGLDTFAQRRPDLTARLLVFEVDRPGPQEWKRRRLVELGFGIPSFLRLVPVDFESGGAWWKGLAEAGFDATRPAIVASGGVSMYLTGDAIGGNAAAGRVARAGLDACPVLPVAGGIGGSRRASRDRARDGGGTSGRHTLPQLLHDGGDGGARS